MIIRKLEKLCGRIGEFAKAGRVIDLGAAISAFQRDVSTEYVLGKDYNSLDQPDFSVGMTRIMHGGGRMWHLTKHIRWYGPAMLSIPKEFLIKSADPDTSNFMRYARVHTAVYHSYPRGTVADVAHRTAKRTPRSYSKRPLLTTRMMTPPEPSFTRSMTPIFPPRTRRSSVSLPTSSQ